MNEIENRGNLAPEKTESKKGYSETQVFFIDKKRIVIDNKDYVMSENDNIAIEYAKHLSAKKDFESFKNHKEALRIKHQEEYMNHILENEKERRKKLLKKAENQLAEDDDDDEVESNLITDIIESFSWGEVIAIMVAAATAFILNMMI